MKLGIVGLPNVGKSTLFNSLTKAGALAANYPFATIDPNVGIVAVPDERLDVLTKMYDSDKTTPATIEFVDIAGLVKGASKGEGLGNQFLANIRECDAIVHVVRCFDDTDVVHVDGSVDPIRDIETINIELIFSDLEVLERRISKTVKLSRNDKQAAKELEFQNRIKAHLEANKPVRTFEINEADDDEKAWLHEYCLLTEKKVIYAANVGEDDMSYDGASNDYVKKVRDYAAETDAQVFTVCAQSDNICHFGNKSNSLSFKTLSSHPPCPRLSSAVCTYLLPPISYSHFLVLRVSLLSSAGCLSCTPHSVLKIPP